MLGEHWILIANFRHEIYFADPLGCKVYNFLSNNNQHYKQMMPAPLQYHPSVCNSYTIYAAFHIFKFRQEEITGVHDVNVLSFISSYMWFFNFCIQMCSLYYVFVHFYTFSVTFSNYHTTFLHSIRSKQDPHA